MEKFVDSITRKSLQAIDLLSIHHKVRTSLGIVVGVLLHTVHQICTPLIQKIEKFDFTIVTFWQFITFGIFVLHIPTIFQAFSKQPIFDENIEKLFAAARKANKEGNLTLEQKRMIYLNICNKVLEKVVLNEKTKKEMQEIEDRLRA
ncbi:MAG: hypothetical protein GF353_02105 [Candidatus Lokiarchaeota archaeon]|nr:hypothetical protein [Candidatus Lokiarchaeota archaeon]